MPQWELEVPKLEMPKLVVPKAPQLPSLGSLPQLPSFSAPQLPQLPSLEVGSPDLGALRQLLGQLQRLTAEQWANLRAAAAQVAPGVRRAAPAPVPQEAAAPSAPAQQAQQLAQTTQDGQQSHAAAPGAPGAEAAQQQSQPQGEATQGAQQVAAAQQQQQRQQQQQQQQQEAEGQAVPSASAATLEAGGGQAGLRLAGRLPEAVPMAVPPVQLPRLGLREWRTGGITAWGWALLALLVALVMGAARALLVRAADPCMLCCALLHSSCQSLVLQMARSRPG
jgi:hypothetical protein